MGLWPALFASALLLRIGLVMYGEWQDKHMAVKFTDVDYVVYTDASRYMANGESPYLRHTYRYTPLVAGLLLPNLIVPWAGKLLFLVSDLLSAWLQRSLLRMRGTDEKKVIFLVSFFLFNPLVFTVSTRGNADILVSLLVLLSVWLMFTRRLILSAIVFGLSVHLKIYPVVFGLSMLVFLDEDYDPTLKLEHKSWLHRLPGFVGWFFRFMNKARWQLFLISASTFLLSTAVCYVFYGWEFLYETYLYHFARTDNRHNFSIYFYLLYLQFDQPLSLWSGLLAFLPQMGLMAACAWRLGKDLPLCICLQTILFVAFNKVCTAQYFLWYITLLPVALASCRVPLTQALLLLAAWGLTEAHWLLWAYRLEFLGENVFVQVWLASALFFAVQCCIAWRLMRWRISVPLFSNGEIVSLPTSHRVKSD